MGWRIRDAIRRRSTACFQRESKSPANSQSPPTQDFARTAISASAADTVLKTPELLELVLAHLDQEELLRAPRVCRHWKEIIGSSLPLRRRLYLSPTTKIDERIPVDNAWLKSRFPDFGIYLLQGNPKWRPKFIKALGVQEYDTLGAQFFADANASWRNMLLTQPPIKEIVVYSHIEEVPISTSKKSKRKPAIRSEEVRQPSLPSMEEMIKASVTVKNSSGITMGMVVNAGIEARKRGAAAAKRQVSDRKDSGYISMDDRRADDIEISVIEISD